MIESPMRDYGKINAWELCTYEEYGGVQISPSDVDCFLHLLFSNSSESIEFLETHTRPDWGATLRLWGALADEAVCPASEAPRLYTDIRLRRSWLHYKPPLKEEHDEFVGRLHELGGGGERFRETCKALRVRMLGRS